MGSLVFDGRVYPIDDDEGTFSCASNGMGLVMVQCVADGLLEAVGGAYYSTGGGGRWIMAKFSTGHAVGPVLTWSEVRRWVITERQSSINVYSASDAQAKLLKLLERSPKRPPVLVLPDGHDVTYSDPLWDI